jgi:hypothetical protein
MSARRRALVLPLVGAVVALAFAAAALADTSSISGTVPNGGCDAARSVNVSGPSRIEVSVSSTSADTSSVLGEIVGSDGRVVAAGSYDTPGGGTYSVQVCSLGSSLDPPQIQYTGLIGTGPSGQPVLQGATQPQPADNGGVLGATATLQTVNGKGAIMTRAGLAWFTLTTASGHTTLRVVDPVHHMTRVVKGMQAAYGSGFVRVAGSGVKLVLLHTGASSRITFTSPRFRAGGKVVRGGFDIVA